MNTQSSNFTKIILDSLKSVVDHRLATCSPEADFRGTYLSFKGKTTVRNTSSVEW